MIEKMRLLITMKHNQEKEEKEKYLSSLEEQLKGDENLILKIQELARKEVRFIPIGRVLERYHRKS
jgi:hypothetical protein